MTDAVERHLKNTGKVIVWREVKLGRGRVDLVAYDKNAKLFKIFECKLHSKPINSAKTFGQAVNYLSTLDGDEQVSKFLDVVSSKEESQMKFSRWLQATHNGKRIIVAAFVAFTDKACKQPEFHKLRERFPRIGVIRVKPNGYCRDTLPRPDGTRDPKAAQARPEMLNL